MANHCYLLQKNKHGQKFKLYSSYSVLQRNFMKNLLLFAFLFMASSTGVFAQVQRNTDSSQTRVANNNKAEKMQTMQSLNLTKEQKGQLKEIRQTQKQQRQAIMDDQSLSDMQRRQKMNELRKAQNDKLRTILSPEQMDQLMQQRKNNMQQHRQNKNGQADNEEGVSNSKQETDSTK